ncbi:hypothetical protein [Bacillus sp. KH172YL63]|uniref:hypothetical protein n=1 Tax=Bacillus sp. KH172YL63 TaxID=2709784 RepID=UPI001563AA21|nr:hypothetical protein [Bacillus sp. KH172YL63]
MNKLRIAWIIPNVLLYIAFIFLLFFITGNDNGLKEINALNIYVVLTILIFAVAVFGSIRIAKWMREGKL